MKSLGEQLEGKRVGLVLSAGFFGFYGHAGFLDGLLQAGIVPAAYAGSSAGGMIGALAAAGLAPAQIIELLRNLRRRDFWDPDPLGAVWQGLRGGHAPSGILAGKRFQDLLASHLPIQQIEDCKTPLALATTNLTRSRLDIFRAGPLAPLIHATCAYPGLFRAVEIGGELHWDGGLVDKAPLLALIDAPLDVLLVHYLPSRGRDRLGGAFAYAQGLDIGMSIARREHFTLQLEVARARKLPVHVVVSDLPALSPLHMERGVDAVDAGRSSVRRALAAPPTPFSARG
jgi:NTE family protein